MKKPIILLDKSAIILLETIERRIYLIRGQKVMLSTHLAELYKVQSRALVQAVKRNIDRFPEDFMFQLTDVEFKNLKSQIVTSSWGGPRRAAPYAFTEQGVAMLSSVLRSKTDTRFHCRGVSDNIPNIGIEGETSARESVGSNPDRGCGQCSWLQ